MKIRSDTINLLPKEYKQAEEMRRHILIIGGILILEVALFIIWIVIPLRIEIQETNSQLEAISLELNDERFININQVMGQLEQARMERDEWMQRCETLQQEKFVSSRLLDSVLSRIPLHVTINKLIILSEGQEASNLEKNIFIEGTSQEMISILNYVTILEGVYGTETVHYEMEDDEENERYTYQISIRIQMENLEIEEYTEETDLVNYGGESW